MINDSTKSSILKITSVFENNTPELQYNYIEALNDGRGYTFGYCGFTTGTGDGVEVVRILCQDNNPLKENFISFLPRLEELAKTESGSIEGLEGFDTAWKNFGGVKEGIDAQQSIGEKLYWTPAVQRWNKLKWKTPLGLACIYDTIIQHGDGKDRDSLGGILRRTHFGKNEKISIRHFLRQRRKTLKHPFNKDTQEEWKWSTPRVDALLNILQDGNVNLENPIVIRSSDFNASINN